MDNKLVHFMDLIVFHPSGMKSSALRTLVKDFSKLVHFMDNKLIHFMDFILWLFTL